MSATFITGLQHVGIPTNDIEATIEFYTSLGFEPVHRTENPANGEQVCFLALGNLCIETYQNGCAVGTAGEVDHIALDVTDIDQAFREIQQAGYRMLDQQVQSLPFWERGVRFFTILGPNGEKVEFCQKL